MTDLFKEIGRKLFHMLSLVFLAAYWALGYPRVLHWMVPWAVFVLALETARLRIPRLNDWLLAPFSGMAREKERSSFSGIFHTTFGALILFLLFGGDRGIVAVSLYCVAFGDTAAALAGKSWGRHKIAGGKKSYEGSFACLLTCVAVGLLMGFDPVPAFLAALAATAIEVLPTTAYMNDNLWMPVSTAIVLRLFR